MPTIKRLEKLNKSRDREALIVNSLWSGSRRYRFVPNQLRYVDTISRTRWYIAGQERKLTTGQTGNGSTIWQVASGMADKLPLRNPVVTRSLVCTEITHVDILKPLKGFVLNYTHVENREVVAILLHSYTVQSRDHTLHSQHNDHTCHYTCLRSCHLDILEKGF